MLNLKVQALTLTGIGLGMMGDFCIGSLLVALQELASSRPTQPILQFMEP